MYRAGDMLPQTNQQVFAMMLVMLTYMLFVADGFQPLEMKDALAVRPLKVERVQDTFFVLDFDTGAIQVYDADRFLFAFGRRGQGPGEYTNPQSFTVTAQRVYLLESLTGVVHIYSATDGHYETRLKLEQTNAENKLASDICVVGDTLYAVYNRGLAFVKAFDKTGRLKRTYRKTKEHYATPISNSYELWRNGEGQLWVFSKFDGSLTNLDLTSGALTHTRHPLPVTEPILAGITSSKDSGDGSMGLTTINLFHPLQQEPTGVAALAMPSVGGQPIHQKVTYGHDGSKSVEEVDLSSFKEGVGHYQRFGALHLAIDRQGDLFVRGK